MPRLIRVLLGGLALLVATLLIAAQARAQTNEAERWHRLVGIVQYLESDYPVASASGSAVELAEQRSMVAEALVAAKALGPQAAPFVPRLEALRVVVDTGKSPDEVKKLCVALVDDLVKTSGVARSPRRPPDLARGRALYEASCAPCHAMNGNGEVPIAASMDPRPSSLIDGPRRDALTPYKVFNTIAFGVPRTAMPSFPTFDESDRWSIAFHVMTLRAACSAPGAPVKISLERLATATDAMLASEHGAAAVPCLRASPPSADEEGNLLAARAAVEDAIKKAKAGDWMGARQAVLDAYLSGVEPVEPLLRARDEALVRKLEEAFLETRLAAEQKSDSFEGKARRLISLLDRARSSRGKSRPISVFWLSLFIVLREGFEVTVVLAALLAVLKKADARRNTTVVHAGWISALVVGVVVFVFARKLLVGSRREWMEGVVAIAAVFMLLYAALWLNARSNMRRFMGELRTKMNDALGEEGQGRVSTGLFVIAFTSMLRESIETAIFLQGLAIDSVSATAWGALAGAIFLIALVVGVGRLGYKLPMKALFSVSTTLLYATAVVLLGKGIHALQEVGVLPLKPIPMVRLDILGLYADAFSFGAQVLLALAPLVWWLVRRNSPGDDIDGERAR